MAVTEGDDDRAKAEEWVLRLERSSLRGHATDSIAERDIVDLVLRLVEERRFDVGCRLADAARAHVEACAVTSPEVLDAFGWASLLCAPSVQWRSRANDWLGPRA